jgi:hypothetical protein
VLDDVEVLSNLLLVVMAKVSVFIRMLLNEVVVVIVPELIISVIDDVRSCAVFSVLSLWSELSVDGDVVVKKRVLLFTLGIEIIVELAAL